MRIILTPDDLELGMFVTIYSGKMEQKEYDTFQGHKTIESEKQSFLKGKVLKIKAINSPYIVVEYHNRDIGGKNKVIIDTIDIRDFNLMSLSKEFVIERDPFYSKDKFVARQRKCWIFDQEI